VVEGAFVAVQPLFFFWKDVAVIKVGEEMRAAINIMRVQRRLSKLGIAVDGE
jgi:hypothetical protein